MGLIRKTMSVSTLGIVDYRSDKERTAKYTRQTRNAARAQAAQQMQSMELQRQGNEALNYANVREEVKVLREGVMNSRLGGLAARLDSRQGEPVAIEHTTVVEHSEAAPSQPVSQLPPAGWYIDPDGSGQQRWFDGAQWTDFKKPVE